jgi:hypothetical protein
MPSLGALTVNLQTPVPEVAVMSLPETLQGPVAETVTDAAVDASMLSDLVCPNVNDATGVTSRAPSMEPTKKVKKCRLAL